MCLIRSFDNGCNCKLSYSFAIAEVVARSRTHAACIPSCSHKQNLRKHLAHDIDFKHPIETADRRNYARILPLCLKTNYVEHRGKIFSDEAGDDGSRRADEKV